MLPLGPLAALALGSLRQHWRVTLALLLGSLLLSGALAAVPITHERLRDAALRDSLATAPVGRLELRVSRDGVALDRVAYRDAQAALDQAVASRARRRHRRADTRRHDGGADARQPGRRRRAAQGLDRRDARTRRAALPLGPRGARHADRGALPGGDAARHRRPDPGAGRGRHGPAGKPRAGPGAGARPAPRVRLAADRDRDRRASPSRAIPRAPTGVGGPACSSAARAAPSPCSCQRPPSSARCPTC